MYKSRVTKLKLTAAALRQLQQLQLSIADLDLIICFSRKINRSSTTFCHFDPMLAPELIRSQLAHLTGITLRAVSGEIVEIYPSTQSRSTTEEPD